MADSSDISKTVLQYHASVNWASEQDLTMGPKATLVQLARRARGDRSDPRFGCAWPSISTLAKEVGCSARAVARYLDCLKTLGYIEDCGKAYQVVIRKINFDNHANLSGVRGDDEDPTTANLSGVTANLAY